MEQCDTWQFVPLVVLEHARSFVREKNRLLAAVAELFPRYYWPEIPPFSVTVSDEGPLTDLAWYFGRKLRIAPWREGPLLTNRERSEVRKSLSFAVKPLCVRAGQVPNFFFVLDQEYGAILSMTQHEWYALMAQAERLAKRQRLSLQGFLKQPGFFEVLVRDRFTESEYHLELRVKYRGLFEHLRASGRATDALLEIGPALERLVVDEVERIYQEPAQPEASQLQLLP